MLFLCDFVEYPRHTQISRRSKCGTPLLKTVKTNSSTLFRPCKLYPYCSLVSSLTNILQRRGNLSACNNWRQRQSTQVGIMRDVYDGQAWKNLSLFVNEPNCITLSLNVDWFQPYKRSQYSVGVIYFAILNLPRAEISTTQHYNCRHHSWST